MLSCRAAFLFVSSLSEAAPTSVELVAKLNPENSDEMNQLLVEADTAKAQGNLMKAERTLRKAIIVEPDNPLPYDELGDTFSRAGDGKNAAWAWTLAMERYPEGSAHWAKCGAFVFSVLSNPLCAGAEKPSWWNDKMLKEISAQMTRDYQGAVWRDPTSGLLLLTMRGEVLAGIGIPRLIAGHVSAPQWDFGPRTADEVRCGGKCFQAAAKLWEEKDQVTIGEKASLVITALACFKRAQELEH